MRFATYPFAVLFLTNLLYSGNLLHHEAQNDVSFGGVGSAKEHCPALREDLYVVAVGSAYAAEMCHLHKVHVESKHDDHVELSLKCLDVRAREVYKYKASFVERGNSAELRVEEISKKSLRIHYTELDARGHYKHIVASDEHGTPVVLSAHQHISAAEYAKLSVEASAAARYSSSSKLYVPKGVSVAAY